MPKLMAPRRRATTPLGDSLRAARKALRLDQAAVSERVFTSVRQVSRWENGQHPSPSEAKQLLRLFSAAPASITAALAVALGIGPPPAAPPRAHAEPDTPRAPFDAIILAVAEERDVLPLHLRAFAVKIFEEAHRLGISPSEAAALVAPGERKAAK